MTVYLVKDSLTQTMDTIVEWSEAELDIAKAVLEKEGFVAKKDLITYERGKDAVGLGRSRIIIEHPKEQKKTTLLLVAALMPKYCIDDRCEFYHPADWQDKMLSDKI